MFDKEDSSEKHWIEGNSNIYVGRFTYNLEHLSIGQWHEGASLKIGSFCSLGNWITILLGGNHRTDWITTYPFGHCFTNELGDSKIKGHPATRGDVIIGNDVWIGLRTTILSGVTIGSGAVISANSVVVNDVGPYEIVGGNPGKVLKKRFDDEVIDLLLELRWWDLPVEVIKNISAELSTAPTKELLIYLLSRYRGQWIK